MKGFEHYSPVLDLPGVADMLGLSIDEARRMSGEGWIPSTMVGERRLFRRDEVLDWFRSQQVQPPEPGQPVG